MKPEFGDLPKDAQTLLTRTFDLDFSMSDFKAPRWFSAWARDEDGSIAGIFAIEFKYWFDGYVTIVVLDQRCMTKRTLRAIFTAAFSQARRLTAEVEPHNRRALRQVQRMGWQYEGMRRLGIEGKRDVLCFGMLKQECRYLSGYVRPSPTLLNVGDRVLVDPIVRRDLPPVSPINTDRLDLFGGQRGAEMSFADVSTFKQVGAAGAPAEMVAVDATRHPAGMRGVHFAGGHPVSGDADKTMDFSGASVREVPHLWIAPPITIKRPKQTVVTSVGDGMREKTLRGHRSPSTEVKNYDQ